MFHYTNITKNLISSKNLNTSKNLSFGKVIKINSKKILRVVIVVNRHFIKIKIGN